MNRLFLSLFPLLCFLSVVEAQTSDSLQIKKDSIIIIIPIPEMGSIEPFGDTSNHISSKAITYTEYRSLYDILAAEPGMFIRDIASIGQQNQLIINGIDDKNISIMIDGVPYNDHYTGSFNLWRIPVDAIERIELRTGADAIFYDGTSAGGVVNIVTKNFNNNRAMTRLRYSQGISGYTHTDAMFAQNIMSRLNLSFALTHYGFGTNKENLRYRARFDNSNHDSWMIRTKLRYNATQWLNLSFTYSFDRAWTGLYGGVDYYNNSFLFDGLTANVLNLESYEKQFNSHYDLTAAYYPFQDSTLLASLTLYSFDRLREYRDEENRNVITNQILKQIDFASIGRGMKFQLLSNFAAIRFLGYADLKRVQSNDVITLGAKSELFSGSLVVVSPFVTMKNYQSQFFAYGGVEGKLMIVPSVQLFASIAQNLIHDKPKTATNNGADFNHAQRIQESFSVLEAGTQISVNNFFSGRLSYKRTIEHDPVVFDTISPASAAIDPNYYFPTSYIFDAVSVSASLVWNEFHFEGSGNYLKQPSIKRNGTAITLYPELTLHGTAYFRGLLANGHLDLKIGVRGNFYSKQTGMRPYDEFGVWIPSTELQFGPTGTMDLFAVGKIGDAYVHLIWENLTGNQYLLAPVYPMYDRNIRFGLSWEFAD